MDFLEAFAAGITDPEIIEALRQVGSTGSVLKDPSTLPVEDADGNPLIIDQVYIKPSGGKFRVTGCRFGSGNIMDTWYWVFGIGEDLSDDRITVDARYRNEQPRHYPSKLKKLPEQQETNYD